MNGTRARAVLTLAAAVLTAGGLAAGCSGEAKAPTAPVSIAPLADSPANAVRRLEWAVNNRDVRAIEGLLPEDFVFLASAADSAGTPTRSTWTREMFLGAVRGLLVGTSTQPPAEAVTLLFDHNLISRPDTGPGKNPGWHQIVRTSVDLRLRIDSGNSVEAQGNALFFATRGDSAQIPAELRSQAKVDSTRWWLGRFDDETLRSAGNQGMRALGGRAVTLTQVLSLYLPRAALLAP